MYKLVNIIEHFPNSPSKGDTEGPKYSLFYPELVERKGDTEGPEDLVGL